MASNFGDFQLGVYADAVKGVISRFPFDFGSIERKASEALPEWVYRYVSAAAGDGRTQQANIDAYSHYGVIPRMMVSPPSATCRLTFSPSVSPRRSSCARSAWSACARRIFRGSGRRQGVSRHRRALHGVDVLAGSAGGSDQACREYAQLFSAVSAE